MADLLNPSQYRSVYITLRALEERLRQADLWLQGTEESGILYQRTLELSMERRLSVHLQIAEALELIAELAQTLQLPCEMDDACSHIRAALSASWVDLCDVRSSTLGRYGTVNPDLAPVLDPIVKRLEQLALVIANLVTE